MAKVLVKNAADRQQVKRAEKEVRFRERNIEDDLLWVLSTTQGRRFLWGLLEKASVFRNAMTGNSQTFFNLGVQSIGQDLLGQITSVDPDAYVKMMRENKPEGFGEADEQGDA